MKLPLLLSPLSCPLCALHFDHLTSSLWFETCRFLFGPLYIGLLFHSWFTSCWHDLSLCLLFRLTCCWPRVVLCPWNLMRCLCFPSLFNSEKYLSVLSGLASASRITKSIYVLFLQLLTCISQCWVLFFKTLHTDFFADQLRTIINATSKMH